MKNTKQYALEIIYKNKTYRSKFSSDPKAYKILKNIVEQIISNKMNWFTLEVNTHDKILKTREFFFNKHILKKSIITIISK